MAVNKLLQKQQNVCVPISVARKIESKAKENGWGYSRTVHEKSGDNTVITLKNIKKNLKRSKE